jgi:hypothetical protein
MNNMTQPFAAPNKPEQVIITEVTAKEAHLIMELRKIGFGKVIVHKANGLLVRIEPTDSILLNDEDGLALQIDRR